MVAPTTAGETLSIPIGDATEAKVKLSFGGGELKLGVAERGVLVAGEFEDGVVNKSSRPGTVELEPLHPGRKLAAGCSTHWDVRLTAEIPVDLRIDSGANQSEIDLSPLRVRTLELHTGASDTTVTLPAQGTTSARIECGFAQVVVHLPAGVAARVHGRVGFGALEVDESRFERVSDGWVSGDYEAAENRATIDVSGRFGTIRIS